MRNWLPPGSEAWHELPPIQWSHFELNTITNNTENYALLKKHLRSLILKRFPLSSIYSKPIKMFQKFWSHLTTLGTKRETWSELHAVHPQLCNYLLTLLLPVTECLLHVNWYKFCTWGGGGSVIMLKILGTTLKNFITWATRHSEFVQPCCMTTCETQTPYTVHENILTISVQCFQHTVQAHTNQPLCVPSGTHRTDTIPNDEARQLLPYLKFHLRTINHTTWKQKLKDITDSTLNIHIKRIHIKFTHSFWRRLQRYNPYWNSVILASKLHTSPS